MKCCKSGASRILKGRALRGFTCWEPRHCHSCWFGSRGRQEQFSSKLRTDPELQTSSANCARQQHLNNRFIGLKKAQGQRPNYMGGCVIIHCIFNASLSALHFSLPTKSWYFHALSSVQFFILMSGFQCVLLFCFFGGVLKHRSAAPDDIKIIQVAAFCDIYGECCRDVVTGTAVLHKHCVIKHGNSNY